MVKLLNLEKVWEPDQWELVSVNEKNLYQSVTFCDEDGMIAEGEDGITVELNEDKVLKIDGVSKDDKTYTIGSTTLKAGTSYVFDSSMTNGSKGSVYMSIRNTVTDTVIASSYNKAIVIEALEADTAVSIEITIVAETEVNMKLKPILCEADSVDNIVNYYK